MSINVTGPGALGDPGYQTNAQQTPAPDPTGGRAAVGDAMARGNINPQNIGNVNGNQYQSAGANGVTRYGLFSNGSSGMAPPQGGTQPSTPHNSAPPGWRPPQPPAAGTMPNPMNPGAGFHPPGAGLGPPTANQFAGIGPPQQGGSMNGMGINFGNVQQQMANAMRPPQLGGQPTAAPYLNMAGSTAPHQSTGFSSDNGGNGSLHSIPQDQVVNHDTGAGGVQGVANAAVDAGNGNMASGIGSFLGNQVADFTRGYDDATGGGQNQSFSDYFNAMAPGFQQNSLVGAVGQDWQSAMDPAAWQQMAQNRMTDLNTQNIADLNVGERRLADRQGRTGLANNGGILGNMYSQFANRGAQNNRQVFNDTLNNQMSAMNQGGQYALGQNAQDLQRWQALNGVAAMGAQQDLANRRTDNPSGGQVLQDLLGAAGQAVGGGQQAAGGMLGMLPMLLGA